MQYLTVSVLEAKANRSGEYYPHYDGKAATHTDYFGFSRLLTRNGLIRR